MKMLENDLLSKMDIIEVKKEVTSILHGLHFDSCYHIEDCIMDLHQLLVTLDNMEIPQYNLMKLNQVNLTKEAITRSLISENITLRKNDSYLNKMI
ncbi:hypothetical protein AWH56_018860 [Anaerobacillus isosaccharinicus]|uniref:Uncharacterized protein n=1 Tax=Anaerobacillus isosaccharinicus TaxID=1532552 RepID=A0A1S2MDH9_9BACI|nr:hypothetical protein [Anaerobacillus isosaccharinicus]MBA5587033.1 hypothetical protein [Anaerobacillus isosaccharinicus]QOY34768.1 hypothetical protein AWH56_018860 [Anaerobacillus isosaccharinicus]